jgi:hypothetical protein
MCPSARVVPVSEPALDTDWFRQHTPRTPAGVWCCLRPRRGSACQSSAGDPPSRSFSSHSSSSESSSSVL